MVQTEQSCWSAPTAPTTCTRHPLRSVLAELKRLPSVTAVELGPLDGERHDGPPVRAGGHGPRALGMVVARAEGNPFYAEELLAAVAEGTP